MQFFEQLLVVIHGAISLICSDTFRHVLTLQEIAQVRGVAVQCWLSSSCMSWSCSAPAWMQCFHGWCLCQQMEATDPWSAGHSHGRRLTALHRARPRCGGAHMTHAGAADPRSPPFIRT